MEHKNNELLEVQIKHNNDILVNEFLESNHTKGDISLSEPIKNISAKITLPDGNFTSTGLRKDGNNFSCNLKVGNNDYSKEVFVIVTPMHDAYQYRITVMNHFKEVA